MARTQGEREPDLDAYQEDTYREYVKAAADAEPCEVFLNRETRHAAVILEFLFKKAVERVEILTGKLNPSVYGVPGTVEAATLFLDKKWTPNPIEPALCILIENRIDLFGHPLISRVSGYDALVEVRAVPEALKATYPFHLIVADSKHYRFEQSRASSEAVVQFNAADTGEKFHAIFQNIWKQSDRIALRSRSDVATLS